MTAFGSARPTSACAGGDDAELVRGSLRGKAFLQQRYGGVGAAQWSIVAVERRECQHGRNVAELDRDASGPWPKMEDECRHGPGRVAQVKPPPLDPHESTRTL